MKNYFLNNFFVTKYKYLYVFIIGCLLSFSLPPYNQTWISFFAFPLLLLFLIKNQYSNYKSFFIIGCSFGFGYFLCSLYWIHYSLNFDPALIILKPLSIVAIPVFLSFFYGLSFLCVKNFVSIKLNFIIIFSIVLAIFDFVRGYLFTGFPWNLFVYTWSWSLESIQILNLFGTYSLNLLSIFFFSFPLFIYFQDNFQKKTAYSFVLLFILSLNFYYGFNSFKKNNLTKIPNLQVVSVQPDRSLENFLLENNEINYINQLIKISNPQIYKKKQTVFVWPEGVLSNLNNLKIYESLIKDNFFDNQFIIFGATNLHNNKMFNSMVVIDNNGKIINTYSKIKLVPFGEFIPFTNLVEKLNLKKITFGYGSFESGLNREPIPIFNTLSFLPLICYEMIFSGKINPNKKPYDFIINISEDGWFAKSIGVYQHFIHSKYRAIEEGKHIIRSTNQGFSSSILPNGIVNKVTKLDGFSKIITEIFINEDQTIFSFYKNKIFYLLIIILSILVFIFRKNE